MIRERQLGTLSYADGQTQLLDIPRDAVFHLLQFACHNGTLTTVGSGSTVTGPTLDTAFPFSLMRNIRLIRNGSDVVWQGSGAQLAKEHYYLNNRHPKARMFTTSSNVDTVLTGTFAGQTLPAVSNVIGENLVNFVGAALQTGSYTAVTNFSAQAELWLQMGLTGDNATASLVDARKLATFQLEVTWASVSSILVAGIANVSNTISASFQLLSIDQDNVNVTDDFATFKRSANTVANFPYGSGNQQVLLPRGNFWHGIIISTRAYKALSTSMSLPENNVLGTIDNRINSNFSLRKVDFNQLQAKNASNNKGRDAVPGLAGGSPMGWAMIEYTSAMEAANEMIPSYVMDQFDLQLQLQGSAAASNGATTASTNPVIDFLYQEVIPSVSVSSKAPQGAFSGSIGRTSAKPYVK
ncbi:MAG: hypothetical protein ABI351_13860 [Herbaspirillum sp.]